jgi:hypothetical protein
VADSETVTKRRVLMRNVVYVGTADDGTDVFERREVVDYVPDDVREGVNVLDAYLTDARTRWQHVEVSEEPDAGPLGYHGPTTIPASLDHPLAGQTFDATADLEPDVSKTSEPKGGGGKSGTGVTSTFLGLQALMLTLGLGLASAALIQTTAKKNTLASAYATDSPFGALYSTVPGAAAGTELTGGTPAYARKALTWSAPANGVITATATFDVASGSTVAGAGIHSAVTAGTYTDGTGVTSQTFASQGTYALTLTYTQT